MLWKQHMVTTSRQPWNSWLSLKPTSSQLQIEIVLGVTNIEGGMFIYAYSYTAKSSKRSSALFAEQTNNLKIVQILLRNQLPESSYILASTWHNQKVFRKDQHWRKQFRNIKETSPFHSDRKRKVWSHIMWQAKWKYYYCSECSLTPSPLNLGADASSVFASPGFGKHKCYGENLTMRINAPKGYHINVTIHKFPGMTCKLMLLNESNKDLMHM